MTLNDSFYFWGEFCTLVLKNFWKNRKECVVMVLVGEHISIHVDVQET